MWTITPTTAPTALRTTPLRDATSGAIPRATGETRPAWIVTGGRGQAGRADPHAGLLEPPPSGVGFPPLDRLARRWVPQSCSGGRNTARPISALAVRRHGVDAVADVDAPRPASFMRGRGATAHTAPPVADAGRLLHIPRRGNGVSLDLAALSHGDELLFLLGLVVQDQTVPDTPPLGRRLRGASGNQERNEQCEEQQHGTRLHMT